MRDNIRYRDWEREELRIILLSRFMRKRFLKYGDEYLEYTLHSWYTYL
jgi:hypothetical protein